MDPYHQYATYEDLIPPGIGTHGFNGPRDGSQDSFTPGMGLISPNNYPDDHDYHGSDLEGYALGSAQNYRDDMNDAQELEVYSSGYTYGWATRALSSRTPDDSEGFSTIDIEYHRYGEVQPTDEEFEAPFDMSTPGQQSKPTPTAAKKDLLECKGCDHKAFARSADLERHNKMVHISKDNKRRYSCDYRKCLRYNQPFFRRDHFRDHLRDFHKEDLPRRGAKAGSDQWWKTRAPGAIYDGWWRCNRCLAHRVDTDRDGYVCPGCGDRCEMERQKYRELELRGHCG
ncbi:hypothetical protein B0H67DRAFT_643564 [Lasiosphaeris hirsuta]|uniref:C2H2-type domain-containing protein n=1 Tax=Lasiosphaeris hirsuta TaxID=260670 RepID=A0AA40DYF2_9PEZI|nr:hypothetical protein B0H67DRAFT_643564 [Lasiosphaeris hirsuta]